ncbi:MAG: hypothetical protein Q8867_04085 [Bacteroidota bacterium]|nr:hypothetical protein [Bacteroidota bacterium]
MRHNILLTLAGSLFYFCTANSQTFLSKVFPYYFPTPEVIAKSLSSPAEWKQDSTWEWNWNTVTSSWQKNKRTLQTFNGCGKLMSQVSIFWDFNMSEWTNSGRISNEYFPDNTTLKNQFRMTWNKTGQTWVEIGHSLYNSDGKITEYESREYDGTTNSFTSGGQTIYSYYSGGMQEIRKTLDPVTMIWKNYSRVTTVYDVQGSPVSLLIELWSDVLTSWVNMEYYTMTYNSQEQMLEENYSLWDQGNDTWNNYIKITYEYNASGWLVNNNIYSWDNNTVDWKNSAKIIFHYDQNGLKIQAESYDWDDVTQAWINNQKEVYSYYSNGNPHETFRYIWILSLGKFMEFEYTCLDENGNQTETYHKDINYQTNEYSQGSRTVDTYTDGLLMEVDNQTLVVPGNTWDPANRQTNTWDADKNLIQELYENYDNTILSYVNSTKNQYFFSSYIGIDEKKGLSDLCYFKNPVTPGETIHCSGLSPEEHYNFRLLTLQGQTVFDTNLPGNGSVIIPESLSNGSYLLMITNRSGKTISGKILVIH